MGVGRWSQKFWGRWHPASGRWGRADPLEIRYSPTCINHTPNLVALDQTVWE